MISGAVAFGLGVRYHGPEFCIIEPTLPIWLSGKFIVLPPVDNLHRNVQKLAKWAQLKTISILKQSDEGNYDITNCQFLEIVEVFDNKRFKHKTIIK